MAGRAERLGYVQGAVLPEQSAGLGTWAVGVGVDRAYSVRPEHVAKLVGVSADESMRWVQQ